MKLNSSREIEEGVVTKPGSSKKYKTGNWRTFRPVVDFNKCIHCMRCVMFCPDICIPVKNGKRLETDFDFCKGCLVCVKECPVKCIKVEKENG